MRNALGAAVLAMSLVWTGTVRAGDAPKTPDPLVGTWHGIQSHNRTTMQYTFKVQKSGTTYTARGLEWYALTETQALAASRGQKPANEAHTSCIGRQWTLKLEDDIVSISCQSSQPLIGKLYDASVMVGKYRAPGLLIGNTVKDRTSGDLFRFWKEGALDKPAPLDLEKGKTLAMECLDGGGYHYSCYIPRGYDPDNPTPVLINFDPGGNALPLSVKLAEETGWIMAGLTESKNGPYSVIFENRDAVLFDLRRRFNVDMHRVYFSGFSGGARAASEAGRHYPGMTAGLIMIGAGHEANPPEKDVAIFYIVGETDPNKNEVETAFNRSKALGRKCQLIIHPGGHEWGRPEDIENALPDVATVLTNLGLLYGRTRRLGEGESLLKRALAIREKTLGKEHPAVAASLLALGSFYEDQRKYTDVEPMYKRALDIQEKALGPEHPAIAHVLGVTGALCVKQQKYKDAEPLLKRSLAICEKAHGPDHLSVATAMEDLAGLSYWQGQYEAAESFYRRALAIREKINGSDNLDVATSLSMLAGLIMDRGKYADAEPLCKRALAIREKVLGAEHPDVASVLESLGYCNYQMNEYEQAESLYKRALSIREKNAGTDPAALASVLHGMGNLSVTRSKFADAEGLFKRALAIWEKIEPNSVNAASTLLSIAEMYRRQKRYADAGPFYKRALEKVEKVFGPDHPRVVPYIEFTSKYYKEVGHPNEAQALDERAKRILLKSQ